MAEINSFYKSKYTGEQLDRALDNIYDSVLVDGSKPMTGALTIKKADNGHARFDKDHTATADAGTVVEDVDKNGNTAAILLRGADKSARLKFGATNYEMLHSGNIQPYIVPYAQTAEQAAEAAESALEGVREAIENIPEGTATPIVNDLTTGGASMALSAEMGKVLGQRPNPNLLDNWYFGNPVNQRGQTEYKTNGYTVDRWKSSASSNIIAIADGHIDFTVASSGQSIQQPMEHWEEFKGKTLTASMLLAAGATARICLIIMGGTTVRSAYISSGIASVTATIPEEAADVYVAIQSNSANSAVELIAAKCEFGAQQTLAHQDASGKWVLNEIPNYAEELAKCQRYYQLFTAADKRPSNKHDFRPEMRIDATAANTGTITIDGVTYYYADANL